MHGSRSFHYRILWANLYSIIISIIFGPLSIIQGHERCTIIPNNSLVRRPYMLQNIILKCQARRKIRELQDVVVIRLGTCDVGLVVVSRGGKGVFLIVVHVPEDFCWYVCKQFFDGALKEVVSVGVDIVEGVSIDDTCKVGSQLLIIPAAVL